MLESPTIFDRFSAAKGQIAVLIDPDKCNDEDRLVELLKRAKFAGVNYLFVGGSTVSHDDFKHAIRLIKSHSEIPLVLFPGASHQVSEKADALLYLSLISGRNPDFLIGHHVQSAKEVFEMDIEVIPTGYMLIDGGTNSSVAYVSQTTPIPPENASIILNTAKAGILQGKKIIFMDAGSGALNAVPAAIVRQLEPLGVPLIIGGGVKSIAQLNTLKTAGANVIVIGNKLEENIDFLLDIKLYIDAL